MEVSNGTQPTIMHSPRPWRLRLLLGGAVIVMCGVVGTVMAGRWADRQQRDDLYEIARLVRYSVDPELIEQLSGQPTDRTTPAYAELLETFTNLGDATEKIRYIYLMGREQQKVFFFLDSQPSRFAVAGQPPLAEPGETYQDVTESILDVFFNGSSTVVGPETDKWGTFVSALVPIRNVDDHIVALLGVDVDARSFMSNIRTRQLLAAGADAFVLVIYVVIIILTTRRPRSPRVHGQPSDHR